MAKMKDYKVIVATDLDYLEVDVNKALGEGNELIGGLGIQRNNDSGVVGYYQAVAKPARAPRKQT